MATFSQQFLSNLGNPTGMLVGATQLGQALGSVPGLIAKRHRENTLSSLMSKAQEAMAQDDATELLRIAQELTKAGYTKEGLELTELSKEAALKQADKTAGSAVVSGDTVKLREAAQLMADAGRTEEARKLTEEEKEATKRKGKNALSLYVSRVTRTDLEKSEESKLAHEKNKTSHYTAMSLENPKVREGFYRIANAYGLQDEADDLFDDYRGVSDDNDTTFGTEITIRDGEGNLYTRRISYNDKGVPNEIITPITPGASSKPVGKITIVSGTTGGGAWDDPEIKAKETLEKEFASLRVAALASLPELASSLRSAENTLGLLAELDTGGFDTKLIRAAKELFGTQPENEAAFQFQASQAVLDGLKSFKGAISNAEREFLQGMLFSLERSKYANRALLETIINRFKTAITNAQIRASSKNFDDYNAKVNPQNQETSSSGTGRSNVRIVKANKSGEIISQQGPE
jgi:hypothetical protein